jgi:hypothetical protein
VASTKGTRGDGHASNAHAAEMDERRVPIHPAGSPWSFRQIQHNLLIVIAESLQNRSKSSSRPANAGYNQRGTAEQWIKEGKSAVTDAAILPPLRRLGAAAIARAGHNLADFPCIPATPERSRIGQMAEVASHPVDVGSTWNKHNRIVKSLARY